MSGLFGLLGVSDSERVFVSTIGQETVYAAINELVNRYNEEMGRMTSLFFEKTTEAHKLRYYLPGGGRLQRMSGEAPSAEVKAYGYWDVAFPLEQFGAAVGGSRVRLAYMTVQDLDRHLKTVFIQDQNTMRLEILKRIFNNTQRSFSDELWGTLTVESLANGDTVVYPPIIGSETEATEDHYYHTGYLVTAISATNNPCATIAAELEEHFGKPIGGSNVIAFFNSDAQPDLEAISGFVPIQDNWVTPGDDTATLLSYPTNAPGRIIGRLSGCWVSIWDWIPATYCYGQHLGVAPPLQMRVDPSDTGLPQGLNLVARDTRYPLETANWEHRFGVGVGNRLNGVFLEFNASAFSIPTGYTY
jgi:hypothetical protein